MYDAYIEAKGDVTMYDFNQKHYIFKFSNGKVLNIFYREKFGIYMSALNQRNLWSEPAVLIRDCHSNFSACLDENDIVHLLYQDKYGNILETLYTQNTIVGASPVLNSKNQSSYDKHLHIQRSGKTTYFFYVLRYSGKNLLTYQLKEDQGKVSSPRVIDFIEEDKIPYRLTLSTGGDFYILFNCSDNKHLGLGYKKYDSVRDQWSEFFPIKSLSYSAAILAAFVDSKSTLHLCSQETSGQQSKLVYLKIGSEEAENTENSVLSVSPTPFYNMSLIVLENKLLIYWVQDNDIFCCWSDDEGRTWSGKEKYSFHENNNLFCMVYCSNFDCISENLYFNELPGNFIEGYKLAFINDPSFKTDKESKKGAVNTEFSGHLKELSLKFDELKQTLSEMKVRTEILEAHYKRMNPEIEKLRMCKEPLVSNQNMQIPDVNKINEDIDKSRIPVMPGAGFAHITPAYLKSLKDD